jgi:hypothetical protein
MNYMTYIPRIARGLMGAIGLTAGSRAVYSGEIEAGYFSTDHILDQFRRLLQQRGLTVESVSFEDLGIEWTGARMIRVWAQVVTPIDRAQEADLTYDMTQDLQRAGSGTVQNAFLSVTIRAGKTPEGYPIYPGGSTSLPNVQPPGPAEKGFFDQIAEDLKIAKSEAQLLLFGGAGLLLVMLMRK